MTLFRIVFPFPLILALAGCFTSDQPLIAPSEAVFPFKSFTYTMEGEDSSETFMRDGNVYVRKPGSSEGMPELIFKKLPTGHYLAQLKGERSDDDQAIYLYAVIEFDAAAKIARAHKLMRQDEDVGPGLRDCPDRRICIDDLAAYVAIGEAAIAAGGKPDATYRITASE